MMQLFMIDAIGPFFRDCRKKRINWSKIPFDNLESEGLLDPSKCATVREDFRTFVERAAQAGFNALSLDDVAHLIDCPEYPQDLRAKILNCRGEYAFYLKTAAEHGMGVYLTTDVMFFNPALRALLGRDRRRMARFLSDGLEDIFNRFPQVKGVIFRIGESDGLDVTGDFLSELTLRTPAQARRFIQDLLPVFERCGRDMIFRTWSVGAYRVGDLIWNRETLWKVFDGIDSDHLIISLKYGESDFFRHLPLNKQFFRSGHRKIIELQARREYEGFGEYPSFIGWDYEAYRRQLDGCKDLVGAWIWCQTGGWSSFRRLTFLDSSSIWNELNTCVTLRIFKDGMSTEEAVEAFRRERLPAAQGERLLEFLRLSDEVIKELLYIDTFSRRKLFFRRTRIPPLLWIFWDHIVITHAVRKILRCFEQDGEARVREGRAALAKIKRMVVLARELGLPVRDIEFQYDTFEVLAAAREYYFMPFEQTTAANLHALRNRYLAAHPDTYHILLDLTPIRLRRRHLKWILSLLLREQRGYRLIDHVFTLHVLSRISPLLGRWQKKYLPAFAHERAMGVGALLR